MTKRLSTKMRRAGGRLQNAALKFVLPRPRRGGPDLFFIVSTGRTGTKFFRHFFRRLDRVFACHEPIPDFLREGIACAAGKIPREKMRRMIERNRRVLLTRAVLRGSRIYVESNNRCFSLLKPLHAAFPEAGIIHIVRDGRDYVRSGMSRNWYRDQDRTPRLKADMFPDDPWCKCWSSMERFEKIAWRWQKKDGFITRDLPAFDRRLEVKFEDIFLNPGQEGLFRITRFMGIADADAQRALEEMGTWKPNSTKRHAIPKWPEWDAEMTKKFDRIAGEHMQRHAYY